MALAIIRNGGGGYIARPEPRPVSPIYAPEPVFAPKPVSPIYPVQPGTGVIIGIPTQQDITSWNVAHPSSGGTGSSGLSDLFGGGINISLSDGSHPGSPAPVQSLPQTATSGSAVLLALAVGAFFLFRRFF